MSEARWRRYVRFVRPNIAADVDDELAFHVAMRIERNRSLGMMPDEARRDALSRFGDVDAVRRALVSHDQRRQAAEGRREYFMQFLQDVRFGLRALRRAPGFALATTLTLALCIGANAAIFSVIHAVVLRPLPYAHPEQLMSVGTGAAGEFLALAVRLRSFSRFAAWVEQTHPIDDGQEALRVEGAAITPDLLPTLGVSPVIGRGFTDDEAQPGRNNVLLISEAIWRQHFGEVQNIVGKKILVEGVPHTIVGVMPSDFHFPNATTQYWQPLAFNPANVGATWAVWDKKIIARVAPGVSIARAQREVREVWPSLRSLNPLWDPGPDYRRDAAPAPLRDDVVGATGRLLWILFGCVLLVLLVGCVNVANLLLARATAREREFSVRAALGGGRARLIRQLVTESLLLAVLGGSLGVALSVAGVRWLVAVMPPGIPRTDEISVSGTVLLFTLGVALVTGLLFGIVPALRATQQARTGSSVDLGRRTSHGRHHHRVASVLVTTELALAVLLVVGATLLVRSFAALRAVNLGFDASHVIAARLTPPNGRYADSGKVSAFYDGVVDRLAGMRGVTNVAIADKLPMAQAVWGIAIRVQGQFEDNKHELPAIGHLQQVSPGYFQTMRIPVVRGRTFSAADRMGQPPVTIVSQSVARRYWPNEDPIGKRVAPPWDAPYMTIIGVVADTKQDSLRDTARTSIYLPWAQRTAFAGSEMWVMVRSASDPAPLAAAIRATVRDLDRTVAVSDVRTMDAVVSRSIRGTRFTVLLVGAFAIAALLLGAIGIYGVMSYLVGQRTTEMGIRMALGASVAAVIGLIVGRAARVAALGVAGGIIGALFATRWLGSLLYEVSATDPVTFVAVPLLFLVVAVAASYAPARRATRIDPVRALRAE
ncbi:MAG TPA: ABC transporter permease [Gemmatimonadaceae bacterium]